MKTQLYPGLWFNKKAKEAAEYYCNVFPDSDILSESSHAVLFQSSGQKFLCLNGDKEITPNPSVSFFVIIEDKHELDNVWKNLIDGGMVLMPLDQYDWSIRYGWLKDKYNISWQLSLDRIENEGKKFSPMLMFTGNQNGRAEEAINFYTSVFENSSTNRISRYKKNDNDTEGNIVHARFKLCNTIFMAMDSSYPHGFSFNEAISFIVECDTREEIDYYRDKLSAASEAEQGGWVKDKFGVSWQIIQSVLNTSMRDPGRTQK